MYTPLFQLVERAASDAGFERVGVAPAAHPEMHDLGRFAEWVDAGYAGEMGYLKRRNEDGEYKRAALQEALPWAKSVIVAAMNYNPPAPRSIDAARATEGWVSRYAMSPRDYHETVLSPLRRVESELADHLRERGIAVTTRAYVDTGPVLERVYAKYAGIGWAGKNTCIINEELGSWIFLGVIVTSIDYSAFVSGERFELAPDRCGTCTRCIDACPTEAFVSPGQLDASRCIAYFTIEKRGPIPQEMREKIGRHVFGCDICQDVCPWNRRAPVTTNQDFQPDGSLINPNLSQLAHISPPEFRQRFRASPISRAKHSGFLRNVAVAMGNSGQAEFMSDLEELARSEDLNIAEHARWGLERLRTIKETARQPARVDLSPDL